MALSQAQIARHWRHWKPAAAANGWTSASAIRERAKAPQGPADKDTPGVRVLRQIWATAKGLAQATDNGQLTPDQFRHACYVVALRRDRSIKEFSNTDLDRVLNVFALAANPETDLQAVTEWQMWRKYDQALIEGCRPMDRPEYPGERRKLKWSIDRHDAPYVARIVADRFDLASWKTLPIRDLRMLNMTLRNRKRKQA